MDIIDEDSDPVGVGLLLGLLIGEGHFGGDGRQGHVAIRMHVRHEAIFHWLQAAVPGSKLYGPYHHGGRHYYHWVCRGRPLWDGLVPLVGRHLHLLDDHVARRFLSMTARYGVEGGGAIRPPEPAT